MSGSGRVREAARSADGPGILGSGGELSGPRASPVGLAEGGRVGRQERAEKEDDEQAEVGSEMDDLEMSDEEDGEDDEQVSGS